MCVIVYLLGTQSSYPTCWQHWFCPDLYLLYNITILIWEAEVGGCQCQVSASSRISFFSYTPHNLHSHTLFQVPFAESQVGMKFGKDFSRHTSLRSWRLLPSVEWLHQLITDAEVCRPTGPLRPVRTGGWALLHVMRSYPNWSQPKFCMHSVWQWLLHNTTQHNKGRSCYFKKMKMWWCGDRWRHKWTNPPEHKMEVAEDKLRITA